MFERVQKLLTFFNQKPAWFFALTDVGRKRERNEDEVLASPEKGLFIVADGMGGHKSGEEASRQAVTILNDYFHQARIDQLSDASAIDICGAMKAALQQCSDEIHRLAEKNHEFRGMGCAVVYALLLGRHLHIAHVGDCRAYLLRDHEIRLLSTDHSVVMEFVAADEMTLEEARLSPLKNQLTQAVGSGSPLSPGCYSLETTRGDRILLCSDGLWDMLGEKELRDILFKQKRIESCGKQLIAKANDRGGGDNISVLLIDI